MNAIIESEMISCRNALSHMALAAAFGLGAAPTVLGVSDAEAQTVGMKRRKDRREGRHQRRDDRRTGRTERREEGRTGTATTGRSGGYNRRTMLRSLPERNRASKFAKRLIGGRMPPI